MNMMSLLDVARGEPGVAIPAAGATYWHNVDTYWSAQYPWCKTGSALFVCRRNVKIVPIEGVLSLVQLGLLWKERTSVASNQVTDGPQAGEKTTVTYKLRRMWTVASS